MKTAIKITFSILLLSLGFCIGAGVYQDKMIMLQREAIKDYEQWQAYFDYWASIVEPLEQPEIDITITKVEEKYY